MRELFPMLGRGETRVLNRELPLYRECAFDFSNGQPIFLHGSPVVVTGREAVAVWAYKALSTPRARHEIYSWNFGNECDDLIGQHYSEDLKEAEAERYVRECLLANPYITAIDDLEVNFSAGKLSISGRITTIYGEVELSV